MFRLLGESRRAETQSRSCPRAPSLNFFANVSSCRLRGRSRRSRNKGDSAGMAAPLTYCATVRLRSAETKITAGQMAERTRPKRRFDSFVVVAFFAFRAGNHAELITAATLPTRPGRSIRPISSPALLFLCPSGSLPAKRKPTRLCVNGIVAQSRRDHLWAPRLNDKMPPDK